MVIIAHFFRFVNTLSNCFHKKFKVSCFFWINALFWGFLRMWDRSDIYLYEVIMAIFPTIHRRKRGENWKNGRVMEMKQLLGLG